MADPREEINRLIEIAERNAFQEGWHAAIAAVAESANRLRAGPVAGDAQEQPTPARRQGGRPPSAATVVVEECIKANPGMNGVDVVKAAQAVDAKIKERTVRTCLRRLRIANKIWKRNGLWYPKKQSAEFVNGNGEATLPLGT